MTEPNEIEFRERVRRPFHSGSAARGGIVLGSALLIVVGAVAVMGASPSPSASTGADPSAGASSAPGTAPNLAPRDHNGGPGPGFGFGGFGGFGFGHGGGIGFGGITITAIKGSDLSLKTVDGWTRTISATADTAITRAGTTIKVTDLKVGDEIRFAQTKNDDGTFTITKIELVLPTVAGQVTAIDGSTITVKRFDGTTQTIHVDSSTTYTVAGVTDPKLSDIKVDAFIVAQGTQRTDGSLDAEAVHGGFDKGFGHFGDGTPGPRDPNEAAPSTAPSGTPG